MNPVLSRAYSPTDTYSHFNVELLLITVSFFTYSHLLAYFRWLFSLQAVCLQNFNVKAQVRVVTSPTQSLVLIPLSKKKFISQIDSRTNFLERDDYTTAISPGKAKRWAECVHQIEFLKDKLRPSSIHS